MTKIADSIRRGLQQAVSYATGAADETAYGMHIPKRIDVKAIRTNLRTKRQLRPPRTSVS